MSNNLGIYRGPTRNIFCPTGDGGGVDPTCKKQGKQAGKKQGKQAEIEGSHKSGVPLVTSIATPEEMNAAGLYQYASAEFNDAISANPVTPSGHHLLYHDNVARRTPYSETVNHLDTLLEKSVLSRDVVSYRGTRSNRDFAVGHAVSGAGFLSTSLDKKEAVAFATKYVKESQIQQGKPVVFQYKLPSGSNGVFLDVDAGKSTKGSIKTRDLGSNEVLLPRGRTYKVTKVQKSKSGPTIVTLE